MWYLRAGLGVRAGSAATSRLARLAWAVGAGASSRSTLAIAAAATIVSHLKLK